jgi:hypothetical protein
MKKLNLTCICFQKNKIKNKLAHHCFNLHRPFIETESTTHIFFIFLHSKIRVIPTDVVFSLFPPRCHLSSAQCHYCPAPCHASFLWSQDEFAASASSSVNALSHHLPTWAETKALNLHHRHWPPSPDSPTPTLHCYKKVISILANLPTTQPRASIFCLLLNQSTT